MMKVIVTPEGEQHVPLSAEEIATIQAERSQALAQKSIDSILRQIIALEAQQTPRRIREAMLGVQESVTKIAEIDQQITALREQLTN